MQLFNFTFCALTGQNPIVFVSFEQSRYTAYLRCVGEYIHQLVLYIGDKGI